MAVNVQSSEQIYEHHFDSYDGTFGMSPMVQYGEAPVDTWHSVAIAPPLPSARDIAPVDFQQAFVHKCLYPSQSFLVSEGFVEEEEEKLGKQDEVAEVKTRTPRRSSDPQPDYFGHLLGHPISADDDEIEEEETPDVCVVDQAEAEPVVDCTHEKLDVSGEATDSPAALERVETPEVEHEVAEVCPASQPVPSESEKELEISEESTEDDDVDYFGHIMGHPMNHSGSQRKIKSPKAAKEAPKVKEADSQETQGSVLGLFLGGVEVCDLDENIGQFSAQEKEDPAVAVEDMENCAETQIDEPNVPESETVEKAPEVVDAPKVAVFENVAEPQAAQDCSVPAAPEVVAPPKQEIHAPVFASRSSRGPEIVQARGISVEAKQPIKTVRPAVETSTTRTSTKKKGFFAGLCGSRNHD